MITNPYNADNYVTDSNDNRDFKCYIDNKGKCDENSCGISIIRIGYYINFKFRAMFHFLRYLWSNHTYMVYIITYRNIIQIY